MRRLFLIAYDICDPRRLSRAREFLKGYSTGGQKSLFECWLTPAEHTEVVEVLRRMIDPEADRLHVFRMDGRSEPHVLGIAVPPADPAFFYFG